MSAASPPSPAPVTAALEPPAGGWRLALYRVVFESDTPAGRLFDIVLVGMILVSIGVVMADSVHSLHLRHRHAFEVAEWVFTAVFTLEYVARLACLRRPLRYAGSFYGLVDLLALLPTYLALVLPALHPLLDVRVLRLLRIFRIFKLTAYVTEFQQLADAMASSRRRISVFLSAVIMIVLVVGTVMYVVEGPEHGFKDIPTAVYWAITTMTTVGFGDIAPVTPVGRFIASTVMLLGWGTIAVPSGIVTAEIAARRINGTSGLQRRCLGCGATDHRNVALYCLHCGTALPEAAS